MKTRRNAPLTENELGTLRSILAKHASTNPKRKSSPAARAKRLRTLHKTFGGKAGLKKHMAAMRKKAARKPRRKSRR